jgi:hypothetical protein
MVDVSPTYGPPVNADEEPHAVRCINPLEAPSWDQIVTSFRSSTLFHGTAWARVLQRTYGFTPIYFLVGSHEAPAAILPAMGVRSWLTGHRGVSLPFSDECPPLYTDSPSFARLFAEVQVRGRIAGWRSIEMRGGAELFAADGRYRPSTSFWGHRVALSPDENALFAGLRSSTRRAVRKAEAQELTLDVSGRLESMAEFYGLLCLTRKRHGVPPQSWRFFAILHEELIASGRGIIVLARRGTKPIAAAIFLFSGRQAIYKYGASDDAEQNLRANNLVMWNALKWLARHGYSSLLLGRTSRDNEGLRQFKLGWGAEEYPIDYTRFDLISKTYTMSADRSSGWHTSIFRRLPVPVARMVGAALYRHMA